MDIKGGSNMSGETKSKGRKDLLDKFYTSAETVEQCLKQLDLSAYDCIIEPSAGNGSFLKELQKQTNHIYGYDIKPEAEGIICADWIMLDKSIFKEYKNILVCGNPPFGQQNTLAIKFFNEASTFCNTIAFILPPTFRKQSIQSKLNPYFWLIKEIEIIDNEFSLPDGNKIVVPCIFQIWEKWNEKRSTSLKKEENKYFIFCKKEEADFRIQRVGGNAGKADSNLNYSIQSNYFVKNVSSLTNQQLMDIINSIKFTNITDTVGPKSLSKKELITQFNEYMASQEELPS